MSNVTFWAYAMRHPPECTKAISVGMTFGGLLTTGFAASQMGGRAAADPRFGAQGYFGIGALVQVAFWLIFLSVEETRSTGFRNRAAFFARRICGGERVQEPHISRQTSTHSVGWVQDPASFISTSRQVSFSSSAAGATQPLAPACDEQPVEPGDQERRDRGGEANVSVPASKLLLGGCFLVYSATYTLPTVLPFVAGCYPDATERQQLLLWMLVLQNTGDVLGRLCAPRADRAFGIVARLQLVCCGLGGPAAFCLLCFCMFRQSFLPSVIGYDGARVLLPGVCAVFYFSRGTLVTSMYLRARRLAPDTATAERLASNMGFVGQMGALLVNVVLFFVVNVR